MSHDDPHATVFLEPDRVPRAAVLAAHAALVTLSLALSIAAALIVRNAEHVLCPSGAFPERDLGPRRNVGGVEAELYSEPASGLALERERARELGGFAWVGRRHGVVSIPIEDAMRLVAGGTRP